MIQSGSRITLHLMSKELGNYFLIISKIRFSVILKRLYLTMQSLTFTTILFQIMSCLGCGFLSKGWMRKLVRGTAAIVKLSSPLKMDHPFQHHPLALIATRYRLFGAFACPMIENMHGLTDAERLQRFSRFTRFPP